MAVRFTRAVLVPVLVLVGVIPLGAQQTASETLVAGRRAISFQPFDEDGNTTVGLWRVRNENTRFGWLISGRIAHSQLDVDSLEANTTEISLGVGPELRRYRSHAGRIAPFTFLGGQVRADFDHADPFIGDSDTDWSAGLSGRAGFGAEFFPVRNLGLDAQVGLNADLNYSPIENPDGDDGSHWGVSLGTFSASLGGSFYF